MIRSAGTSSRDRPATRSMVSRTDPSTALMTWPTCGTATPARSAITPSSASCSTALNSEAAGLVSPTPRNRMPRQARYSRSASRWSEPKTLTNRACPSQAVAWNGRDPLAANGPVTWLTGTPPAPRAAATPAGPIRRSGTPNATSRPAPTVTPAASASTSCMGRRPPVISRATPISSSVAQAARRHGRLSHGAAATATAASPARTAGSGKPAPASQEPWRSPAGRPAEPPGPTR